MAATKAKKGDRVVSREPKANITHLNVKEAQKFFDALTESPFVALVVTEEGRLRIFSQKLDEDTLGHIKTVLADLREEDK